MTKTWDEIRAVRYSMMDPPPTWPSGVRPISLEGLALLGIDPTTDGLFWDGKQVVLRSRVRLTWWQGFLATLAAFADRLVADPLGPNLLDDLGDPSAALHMGEPRPKLPCDRRGSHGQSAVHPTGR